MITLYIDQATGAVALDDGTRPPERFSGFLAKGFVPYELVLDQGAPRLARLRAVPGTEVYRQVLVSAQLARE